MADETPMTGEDIANVIYVGGTFDDVSGAASTTDSSGHRVVSYWTTSTTNANMTLSGKNEFDEKTRAPITRISATLCFKFIKSKLNLLEASKFKARLHRLEKMVDEFAEVGQIAMAEQSLRYFMQFTKESAMWACGYKFWIDKDHAEKFRYSLKGDKTLKITNLENFGRVIPKDVIRKIRQCNERKLFDRYVIFHLDARGKSSVVETQKQKEEREKDPILFGMINECPDRYYFIADWIDELDDLQFKDILNALSIEKKDIELDRSVNMEDVKKAIMGDSELRKKIK